MMANNAAGIVAPTNNIHSQAQHRQPTSQRLQLHSIIPMSTSTNNYNNTISTNYIHKHVSKEVLIREKFDLLSESNKQELYQCFRQPNCSYTSALRCYGFEQSEFACLKELITFKLQLQSNPINITYNNNNNTNNSNNSASNYNTYNAPIACSDINNNNNAMNHTGGNTPSTGCTAVHAPVSQTYPTPTLTNQNINISEQASAGHGNNTNYNCNLINLHRYTNSPMFMPGLETTLNSSYNASNSLQTHPTGMPDTAMGSNSVPNSNLNLNSAASAVNQVFASQTGSAITPVASNINNVTISEIINTQNTQNTQNIEKTKNMANINNIKLETGGARAVQGDLIENKIDNAVTGAINRESMNNRRISTNTIKTRAKSGLARLVRDRNTKDKSHRGKYQCPKCEMSYDGFGSLRRHIQTHGKCAEIPFQCSECERVFVRKASLKTHITVVHKCKSKQFKCSFCHRKFLTTKGLKSHQRFRKKHKKCHH